MSERPSEPPARGVGVAIAGVLAALLCCALPALVASGALASLGAVLRSPWLWAAAVAVLGVTIAAAIRHRPSGRPPFGLDDQGAERRPGPDRRPETR